MRRDRWTRAALVALLLLSFALRLRGLGRDGLHLDEAGQAWAATQPTLAGMLVIERTHTMAMPLDYLITRATATLSDAEFVLRLPLAVWATLNVALLYALTRLLTGRRAEALLAAFLLALSPLHIGYAQVLRFYASLSAFYALACLLLYRAIGRPTPGRWAAFGAAMLVGAYFHPFVLTVAANGAVYFLLAGATRRANRAALVRFVVASLLVGALFLPGFLVFGAHQQYDFDTFQFSGSLSRVILSGLDWTTTAYATTGPATTIWLWGNVVLAALGLLWLLARRRARPLSLALGAALSVGLIVAAVTLRGYWLLPRQLFHLTQVGVFLVAVGMAGVARGLTGWMGDAGRQRAARFVLLAGLAAFVAVAAGPVLRGRYATVTSTGREAAAALLAQYRPGAPVYIIPGYERQSLQYYLDRPDAAPAGIQVQPATADELAAAVAANDGPVFLALLSGGTAAELESYQEMGFTVVFDNTTLSGRRYMLLLRDGAAATR